MAGRPERCSWYDGDAEPVQQVLAELLVGVQSLAIGLVVPGGAGCLVVLAGAWRLWTAHPGVAGTSGGMCRDVVLTLTTCMPRSKSRLSRLWSCDWSARVPTSSL